MSSQNIEVPLGGIHGAGKFAIVDRADLPIIQPYIWRLSNVGYPITRVRSGRSGLEYMHRIIMDFPKGEVDHRNGNKLDNRRGNLRLATRSENQANNSLQSNNTTGFKGVYRFRNTGRYTASISINKKIVYLGVFDDPVDAAMAYDSAAVEHYGDFAMTNARMGYLAIAEKEKEE